MRDHFGKRIGWGWLRMRRRFELKRRRLWSRKKHRLVKAALWLFTALCLAGNGYVFYAWESIAWYLKVIYYLLLILLVPELELLVESYGSYVEQWKRENNANEDEA
jgi:hypothetical protein